MHIRASLTLFISLNINMHDAFKFATQMSLLRCQINVQLSSFHFIFSKILMDKLVVLFQIKKRKYVFYVNLEFLNLCSIENLAFCNPV